jgi:hypothetical protein
VGLKLLAGTSHNFSIHLMLWDGQMGMIHEKKWKCLYE